MSKKKKAIPVNSLAEEYAAGIAIGKMVYDPSQSLETINHSHRHDYHIFLLIQKGSAHMEVDFAQQRIKAPSLLYIHPSQVHRILKIKKGEFYLLGIKGENIYPEYLKTLEQVILPAQPLPLPKETLPVFKQALELCIVLFERKQDKGYIATLKAYCNALISLIVSQYLLQTTSINPPSRFEAVTKAFKVLLERDFQSLKRPSHYAEALHISTPYLNECLRNATGYPVSYHIQQRIILEAKRLLYHSNKSVKEIAAELGYEDYAYFSRFFTKATGMAASAFRKQNFD
ncbi:AraC-like DNA-binding protein/mannose-6-phosphate isomerase-like protein (cupin superfamily) [Rhabdobacter roseus]|uniref:AraC-like DNA-binding protein/mannose-6-phosphate isomerase-like protein (Cupin superfamily) n=1 Tax=Rhabdobacter roseus TaxID=1655419 RepID=A0A840TPJ7_9BACT|nr:AraC family transcriptional regulator [Rhabdobacter roseus]MBB5285274.1 AraC-like DNA-binding protein/mannose-6-phosphate isomerase-like protein (cupin superfamily) [Rhabdobacter roseus]